MDPGVRAARRVTAAVEGPALAGTALVGSAGIMIGKALLIVAVGLFAVWVGVRSIGGYEAETEHLYGGQFETITCNNGEAVAGRGLHTLSAEMACDEERSEQRNRAPWWLVIGVGTTMFGLSQFRKARAG